MQARRQSAWPDNLSGTHLRLKSQRGNAATTTNDLSIRFVSDTKFSARQLESLAKLPQGLSPAKRHRRSPGLALKLESLGLRRNVGMPRLQLNQSLDGAKRFLQPSRVGLLIQPHARYARFTPHIRQWLPNSQRQAVPRVMGNNAGSNESINTGRSNGVSRRKMEQLSHQPGTALLG